jgi:mevalonate kinase
MNPQNYYSRGKLMISGEYLVLLGATALAIPVRFGQSMLTQQSGSDGSIYWKTKVQGKAWFEAEFTATDFLINKCSQEQAAGFVRKLLIAARELNPDFLSKNTSYTVECSIDFDIRWGLGSSSSLISNFAYWANIDPLELHAKVSKGSGYDVACARSTKPILFEPSAGKPSVSPVEFRPAFSEHIFFIYLGKKKDSQADVEVFMRNKGDYYHQAELISNISRKMAVCDNYHKFAELMRMHEEIMAAVLQQPTLKAVRFSDFPGEIKSLGAWGGDFAMALWPDDKTGLTKYLDGKNTGPVFGFNEMMYDYHE